MKPSLKKFAPYGLYLALLAVLVSGGLYIVRQSFDLPLQISLGVIVVGLALYALLDPKKLRENLTGRQSRYGSNAAILAIAFTGILVVANILVNNNSPRWDLTEDKTNTLAKESLDVMNSLKGPVKAEAYFSTRYSTTSARTLLDKFKLAGKGKFDYEFIDPEANPVRAEQAKVTRDGTIVLVQDDRTEQVSVASESEIVNAMVRLDNPGQRSVYFLTGHGEYDPEGTNTDRSYTTVKQSLVNKNYSVKTLNLIAERQIPQDALALIIAGPDKSLAQEEVDLIKAYLANGGAVVLLTDPPIVTHFGDQPDLLGNYLETDWGVHLGNDLVIDTQYDPPIIAVAASYGQHAITEKMQNQVIVLPTARSIQPSQSNSPDITSTILVLTSQNSWGETSQEELNASKVKLDTNQDIAGPVPVALAAENAATSSRLVVIGDSDFVGETYVTQYGNEIFMINAIDWATGQENLINLTSPQATQRVLILRDQTALGLILLGTVVLLPGIVVVGGIVVWLKRRRKG